MGCLPVYGRRTVSRLGTAVWRTPQVETYGQSPVVSRQSFRPFFCLFSSCRLRLVRLGTKTAQFVVVSRRWQENFAPFAQTCTCRSNSSFFSSKYLFRSRVSRKRSTGNKPFSNEGNPVAGTETHSTVAGVDCSWREKKSRVIESVVNICAVTAAERCYQISSFAPLFSDWVAAM